MTRGQSLVEFALVLPILLFMLLGFGEAAFLFAQRHEVQTSADVLADVAAERMAEMPGESWKSGWQALVNDELARSGCDGDAFVGFPDGSHTAGDRVRVTLSCTYDPTVTHGLWEGLTYAVQGESVVRSTVPEPSPSTSPSSSP